MSSERIAPAELSLTYTRACFDHDTKQRSRQEGAAGCLYSLECLEGVFSEIGALVCACSLLSLSKQFSANSYLLGVSSSTEGKYSSLKVSKGLKEPSRVVRKE